MTIFKMYQYCFSKKSHFHDFYQKMPFFGEKGQKINYFDDF